VRLACVCARARAVRLCDHTPAAWQTAVDFILSSDLPEAAPDYANKDRETIKSKFAGFNDVVDLLLSLHRCVRVRALDWCC
jgi:hypothetical protein